MIRAILLLHRYLGIAVGGLMVMWCLSGVVMMYVGYPALSEPARLQRLTPIAWEQCCRLPQALQADARSAAGVEIEMLSGRPVVTLPEHARRFDASSGAEIEKISPTEAAGVAAAFLGGPSSGAAPKLLGLIDHDQWTVSGDFNIARPLYRFALGDAAGTQLYISSVSGRAVQVTTAHARFWNWLGAVPHWLYFTELRRHASLWAQVVIYASLLGCFLAAIGIYLGARQALLQPAGSWSPYVGFNWWHHLAGLIFGVLTLTWVASGLLSMNPWGWLEGGGAAAESGRIHGTGSFAVDAGEALRKVAQAHPDAVSVTVAPLNGRLYFIARNAAGAAARLDAGGMPAPLTAADLAFLAGAVAGPQSSERLQELRAEDDYYFSHHQSAALPVYRLILNSGTRYYFDPVSGMLAAKFDAPSRAYRWLHEGLHRLDFAAFMRSRPLWDALMLTLMAGVTAVCITGAYLGYRRLTR